MQVKTSTGQDIDCVVIVDPATGLPPNTPTMPSPNINYSKVLNYTSGNLTSEVWTGGGHVWTKSYTYNGTFVATESAWVMTS